MAFARMISQAQPAHTEAPIKSSGPAAQRTTVILPHFELIRPLSLNAQTCLGQCSSPYRLAGEWHAHQLEEHPTFLIGFRRGGNSYREPARLFYFVSVDLGKNNLLPQTQ